MTQSLLVWKTTATEMKQLGLHNSVTGDLHLPSRQQILTEIQKISSQDNYTNTVYYLYLRRNASTHEAKVPQLGLHSNLSVMLAVKLNITDVATLGSLDRIQILEDDKNGDLYFTYFEDNPIHALRWAILKGFGQILLSYKP